MSAVWASVFNFLINNVGLLWSSLVAVLILLMPGVAPTLPPTWTPTFTPAPSDTPTMTRTPTPTVTPSPTQTLTPNEICKTFELVGRPREGVSTSYIGTIGFGWTGAPPDSLVVISLRHVDSDEEVLGQFSADAGINAAIDLEALPEWGNYNWTLSLFLEPYGELCPFTGSFYRQPWWQGAIPNPLDPPFVPQ
jgi:hypothetical protein